MAGTPVSAPRQKSPPLDDGVRLSWDRKDQHRVLTVTALIGVTIAAAMAVLGLPPIDLHGPFHRFGIMDPFCGGTRAARFTAQGEWALAWKYNPLGILAVLGAAAVTGRTAVGLLTRRWLNARVLWTKPRVRFVITLVVLALLALEVRQQLRAELLMAGT